ncbi:hypothetical protein GCM10023156_46760 [Novipirellula rosea]|uniref:Uncharacterized protein n=1 Tax=Novipirellula rosea TaxID=1031540 RepID=A0ABP8NBR9_9BACT
MDAATPFASVGPLDIDGAFASGDETPSTWSAAEVAWTVGLSSRGGLPDCGPADSGRADWGSTLPSLFVPGEFASPGAVSCSGGTS